MRDPAANEAESGQRSGEHERRLAVSTLALQAAQIVGTLTMLAAITVLARQLSLAEFGTYGLVLSFSTYVLLAQGSVETAAVKAIAEASDQHERDRAFSIALTLYVVAGTAAAVIVALGGSAALRLFDLPDELEHQARVGVLVLAATIVVGWPLKVFLDVLRGTQQFVDSAVAEGVAYLVVGGVTVGLVLADAPLWLLVGVGASLPIAVGSVSALIVGLRRLPFRFRRSSLDGSSMRGFLGLSGYLFALGIADLAIYSVDRAILAFFRPITTVGLYEGPVRAHNLLRQVQGSLSIPILPVAARYLADGDDQRLRELLIRGTRYTLAAVVPFVLVFMVMAEPILRAWLGETFSPAATAMTILCGYWLFNTGTSVASAMLVASGRIRAVTLYAAGVALINVVLSLALTPSLGLTGVVLGTSLAYLVGFPFFLRLTLQAFPVRLGELAREAWIPAYSTAAVVASGLVVARMTLTLESLAAVILTCTVAVAAYWALYAALWLRPNERMLVRDVVRSVGRA